MKIGKPYGIIYLATNQIDGKCYVGKTTQTLSERKIDHKYAAKKKFYPNCYFHNALESSGWNNFQWEVLCECESKEILNIRETMKIIVNHSHWTENGYNMTWGGDGQNKGYKPSEETKRKLSISCKNPSEETRRKISEAGKGKKRSEETKQKMRKPKSLEHRLNISKGKKGKSMSVDAIKRMSETRTGCKLSEEHKKKIGLASKGRHHSEKTKEKIRKAHIGKHLSEEHKLKISKKLKENGINGKYKV